MAGKAKGKKNKRDQYILVAENAAGETLRRVVKVKRRLAANSLLSINQACKEEGISRSAYYMYRDHVFTYESQEGQQLFHYRILAVLSESVLSQLSEILGPFAEKLQQSNQQKVGPNLSQINLSIWLGSVRIAKQVQDQLRQVRGLQECKLVQDEMRVL
ncbi:MAG: hypothetical protein Q4D97_01105 [Eubacteriales bacterium]|nr:hypothetical protein [Eubacteriales bacterium]